MRKPSKTSIVRAEVLPPIRALTEADFNRMVAEAVERRVDEVLSRGSDSVFQPFFQAKEISYEIRRRQTVTEQQKWSSYFAKHGCLICGTREKGYGGLGMCHVCCSRTRHRLEAILREHAPAEAQPTFTDTVKLAREALAPSLRILPEATAPRARRKRESR